MAERTLFKTLIGMTGIALVAATVSARADAIPVDQSYLDHLPKLTNLARLRSAGSQHDPVYSAEYPNDENPFARVGGAYGRLIDALLSLNPGERRRYWASVAAEGNATVADVAGFLGDSIGDVTQAVDGVVAGVEGFVGNPKILQCTGALPFSGSEKVGGLSAITQLKHTWLQEGSQSYGMPFTVSGTYFGGDALIDSPDDFQTQHLQDVSCVPIFQPSDESVATFTRRLECVAQKSSTAAVGVQTRQLVLDYNAFHDNCLAAVRFMTECAGGKVSQIPNLDIGGSFKATQVAKFRYKDGEVIGAYDRVFAIMETLDQTLGADLASTPTLTSSQFFNSHSEIFDQLLQSLEDASSLIERDEPARTQGDYRVTVHGQVVVHHEHWLKYVLETWSDFVQERQSFNGLSDYLFWVVQQASLDYPSVAYTTVAQACTQIQDECGVAP